MIAAAGESRRAQRRRPADRAAAAFVLVLLAVGSLALWTAIPLGTAWAVSQITDTSSAHFLGTLIAIPTAMAIFTPALFWLNGLYLRIRAAGGDPVDDEWEEDWDDEEEAVPVRGPLEPLLLASFGLALVAIIVWFFGFAENPLLW